MGAKTPFPDRASTGSWFERGQSLREQGRLGEAMACQHRILARNHKNNGAWIELGRIAMLRGALDEARA